MISNYIVTRPLSKTVLSRREAYNKEAYIGGSVAQFLKCGLRSYCICQKLYMYLG